MEITTEMTSLSQHGVCQTRGWRVWKFRLFLKRLAACQDKCCSYRKEEEAKKTGAESQTTDVQTDGPKYQPGLNPTFTGYLDHNILTLICVGTDNVAAFYTHRQTFLCFIFNKWDWAQLLNRSMVSYFTKVETGPNSETKRKTAQTHIHPSIHPSNIHTRLVHT